MKNRRKFIKNSMGLVTGLSTLPSLSLLGCYATEKDESSEKLPLMMQEVSNRLAFFDPAEGAVPNPGMGINGFVYCEYMPLNYSGPDIEEKIKQGFKSLDRETFDRLVKLPYIDNLYIRYEWRDVQKQKGKLVLPDPWKWTLEASEKYGKRWSFRIMNFSPQSVANNGLPEFLQGKFKMIPYYRRGIFGKQPYYFPEYSDDYLNYWDELNYLLGAEFDNHPNLEYIDVSGYGLWGENHHFFNLTTLDEPYKNYQPGTPERVEAIMDRIIKDHLKAYPKTPAALNIHASEYHAGMKAFEEGLCWARRDSFQTDFRTVEARIAQGLKPGNAMVWEQMQAGRSFPTDAELPTDRPYLLPQRYFDVQAHYVGIGFNPWINIQAHETSLKSLEFIEKNIGYRIRPSLVWNRQVFNKDELVLGLRNDGCSPPPGVITITARFPDGSDDSVVLPAGEPAPGAMKMYAIPLKRKIDSYGTDAKVKFSLKIQMRRKTWPVQWAVKSEGRQNIFDLEVLLA